jgi:uncharacterized protein YndB with AHSA1/START domain
MMLLRTETKHENDSRRRGLRRSRQNHVCQDDRAGNHLPTLRLTHVIARPARDVFKVIIDAGSFASWNPTITSSRQISDGDPGPGAEFEWELRGFGAVRQHLDEFEVDRRVRIVPEMRSLSGGHRFTLVDLGNETRVDHELEMTPKGAFVLMAPMIWFTSRRNLRATAEALRRRVENATAGR